jgi:hypothetical protein
VTFPSDAQAFLKICKEAPTTRLIGAAMGVGFTKAMHFHQQQMADFIAS